MGKKVDKDGTEYLTDPWKDDLLQFCRLLDEIMAVGLTSEQFEDLQRSMDLPMERIDELFRRAGERWEKYVRELG